MISKLSTITAQSVFAPAALLLALFITPVRAGFITFSAGGSAATSSIQSTVDSFRTALGDPNNGNNPGPLVSGRREINWDGGGATSATSNASPLTTFTNTRGSTFTTPGTGFLQTPLNDPALTGINPSYSSAFGVFSPQRIFTPIGSNITDVTFSVPGTNGAIPATVGGFGAVFSDVDLPNVTRIEFFNAANEQIQSLNVLPGTTTNGSFSFLGAVANAGERISRVRITTGNAALGPTEASGNLTDVGAMDDFIYSEPIAVPEPAGWVLAGLVMLSAIGLLTIHRQSVTRQ